jgi:hypothetical protein
VVLVRFSALAGFFFEVVIVPVLPSVLHKFSSCVLPPGVVPYMRATLTVNPKNIGLSVRVAFTLLLSGRSALVNLRMPPGSLMIVLWQALAVHYFLFYAFFGTCCDMH